LNLSHGSGINLTREPRDGRTFEYKGEDPLLAGTLAGQELKAMKAMNVVTGVKHYILNDQEAGRFFVNSVIDKRSMRESDLLAFEIGLPGVAGGRSDVLVQQDQRCIRLRGRPLAERGVEERIRIQGLCDLRLGRYA
jgi:hypothetical protein